MHTANNGIQSASIAADQGGCGSEIGGDPAGFPIMAKAIDALYNGCTADQARATCRQFGIQYLVVRVYDPVWKNNSSWVWTLNPVVADVDFRALDCRLKRDDGSVDLTRFGSTILTSAYRTPGER